MMNRKSARYSLLLISLSWPLLHATPCSAQSHVVLDGKLGSSGPVPLSGNTFNITAGLGKTVGNNLFQSFCQFDLAPGDTAQFTGPMNIQNIIARVTGGHASTIYGTIDTTAMPTANFFFINPFGVIFGAGAQLHVNGSFTATTASYVKLADGGRFDAVNPANDVLTTGPVSAFGFSGMPASISFDRSTLVGAAGQSFSVIGGNIMMNGATIQAQGGRINLISIKSAGELALDVTDLNALPDTRGFGHLGLGTISLAAGSQVDADGDNGGGQIVIRGGTLMVQNSAVTADTHGASNGKGIDIKVTGDVLIDDGGTLRSDTDGSGNAGPISIDAGSSLEILNGGIESEAFGPGTGNAGDITIHARTLDISDNGGINADTFNTGSGGAIKINAGTITVGNGSSISANTTGKGPAGNISLDAKSIVLDGLRPDMTVASLGAVGIYASNPTGGAGDGAGGNIAVHAGSLCILNGAAVGIPNVGVVKSAGSVLIDAGNLTLNNSAAIEAFSVGNGGEITIRVKGSLLLGDNSVISAASGEGNGGNINILAGDFRASDSRVSTDAALQNGGNISLGVLSTINLQNSQITANAGNNGGNISLGSPLFIFDPGLTGSGGNTPISADAGKVGGKLKIEKQFRESGTMTVFGTVSAKGITPGTVAFVGPNLELTGSILPLRAVPLDAEAQLQPYCWMNLSGDVSSFLVRGKGGVALEPSGASPSFELPPYDSDNETR